MLTISMVYILDFYPTVVLYYQLFTEDLFLIIKLRFVFLKFNLISFLKLTV